MRRVLLITLAVALLCGTASRPFPRVKQHGKTAIVAHRGFWNCEEGEFSENSIASLKAAQKAGVWGSECDVQLSADSVVVVNHNDNIEGRKICDMSFEEIRGFKLPNSESRPSLEEYLARTSECRGTRLIIELKPQKSPEMEDLLLDLTVKALKESRLFKPSRIAFISFSEHICVSIAKNYPAFINQFLSSDTNFEPEHYAEMGINGIDYHYNLFLNNPDWVEKAHKAGMSVNVWTVDNPQIIRKMVDAGVDAITSNVPLEVRAILGDKESKK